MTYDFYTKFSKALRDRYGHITDDRDLSINRIKDYLFDEFMHESVIICSLIDKGIFSVILRLKPLERTEQKISSIIYDASKKCEISLIESRWAVEAIVRVLGAYSLSDENPRKDIKKQKLIRSRPFVILVAAESKNVGKTTISRALLDVLFLNDIDCIAIDTDFPEGDLSKYYPTITKIVDLYELSDPMALENLIYSQKSKVIVIDVTGSAINRALPTLAELGFFDRVKNFEIGFLMLHLLEPSDEPINIIKNIAPYIQNGFYYLVKNHMHSSVQFEWNISSNNNFISNLPIYERELQIPYLSDEVLYEVNKAGVTYAYFIQNLTADGSPAEYSFILRGYLRTWLARTADEIENSEILDLLDLIE